MTPSAQTVLVLGAHGRLGHAITLAFADAGWQVRAQSRRPAAPWPAGIRNLQCDAMDQPALIQAAQGVDVIVNALNPQYTAWERLARPLAANALAAAEASGALLLFPGNVYNYGKQLPARLDAGTLEVANTSRARIRIEIEQQLQAAAERGVNSVVLRAGDFFGGVSDKSGRGAWFDLVIAKSLAKGKMVYPGPTDQVHSWAYLPDFAQTFVLAAQQHKRPSGAQRFNFRGHAITGTELHDAMQKVMGKSLKLDDLPWRIIRLLALFQPMMQATLEMRYLWQRPHTLDDAPLRQLLGAIPQTPLDKALTVALAGLGCMR